MYKSPGISGTFIVRKRLQFDWICDIIFKIGVLCKNYNGELWITLK